MKILLLCGDSKWAYFFRRTLINVLIKKNHEVFIHAMNDTKKQDFEKLGVQFNHFNSVNRSKNPFQSLSYYRSVKNVTNEIKPDLVLSFSSKPNTFGVSGAFSTLKDKNKIIPMVEGVGDPFIKNGLMWSLIRFVISFLYKKSCSKSRCTFFLNSENASLFVRKKIIKPEKIKFLRSIGVDTLCFSYQKPTYYKAVGMACRLIKTKGIFEYCELAKKIKDIDNSFVFYLAGPEDEIKVKDIQYYIDNHYITYLGMVDDMVEFYSKISIYVSMSYGEGFPITVLEAMSCGKINVVTNVPGNKDAIQNKQNGFLFEKGDIDTAKEIILSLNETDINSLSIMARKKAETDYNDIEIQEKFVSMIL